MHTLLYGLAALACPVGMGAVMWVMTRGQRGGTANTVGDSTAEQVIRLRAEIDQLKAQHAASHPTPGSR